ncbi:hypothetical protein [Sphingomonas sp. LR55]|uniref:hypothetical protein n=1 Tax=Sphingomonas sp. LR55 TaxID=3050231 RepID=UPI002FE1756B
MRQQLSTWRLPPTMSMAGISLAHATLLIRIEKHFNIDLGPDGSGAQDLGALIALVRRRRDDGARESRSGS